MPQSCTLNGFPLKTSDVEVRTATAIAPIVPPPEREQPLERVISERWAGEQDVRTTIPAAIVFGRRGDSPYGAAAH